MVIHVVVCSAVIAAVLFLPLRGGGQALQVFGASPDARECFDSARTAVYFGSTTPSALKSCTAALAEGGLEIKDRAATHVNRGVLRMALKEYGRALEDFDEAKGLYPRYGAIYVNRGNVFFIRDSHDSAIAEYTKALEVEMNEYQVAYLNRGMAHEILGRRDAAEADYREALALAPEWGLAISKLARVLGQPN